ncbi:MAG: hypothetical protein AAF514_15455 [Verrucomicrobiota bacterium]
MSDLSERNLRDLGPQPLDGLLEKRGWNNHRLVEISTEHLTHKMVARGRKGRRLTKNVQMKILEAVNAVLREEGEEDSVNLTDLFSYRG